MALAMLTEANLRKEIEKEAAKKPTDSAKNKTRTLESRNVIRRFNQHSRAEIARKNRRRKFRPL